MKHSRKSFLSIAFILLSVFPQLHCMQSSYMNRLFTGDDTENKIARFIFLSAAVGGISYLAAETDAFSTIKKRWLKFRQKHRGVSNVGKYGVLGSLSVVGVFVVSPGASFSNSLFAMSQAFCQACAELGILKGAHLSLERLLNSQSYDQPVAVEKKTFKDIAGKIPEEVSLLVDSIKNKEKYESTGVPTPNGILLYGPPGTGKTLLARAIAGEVPECGIFYANAAKFMQIYVGTGPRAVSSLFKAARNSIAAGNYKSAIVFIDEFDALGKRSNCSLSSGEDHRTINTLLSELDGAENNCGMFTIAATNLPELIDDALLRSGRLDYKIEIGLPDKSDREEILRYYLEKLKNVDISDINLSLLAEKTEGKSPADLEILIKETARRTIMTGSAMSDDAFAEYLERGGQKGAGHSTTPLSYFA